jgi:hypothetical protein
MPAFVERGRVLLALARCPPLPGALAGLLAQRLALGRARALLAGLPAGRQVLGKAQVLLAGLPARRLALGKA